MAALTHTRSNLAACGIGSPAADRTGGVMAGYFIANYTITNQAGYKEYLAAVGPILTAHGPKTSSSTATASCLKDPPGRSPSC